MHLHSLNRRCCSCSRRSHARMRCSCCLRGLNTLSNGVGKADSYSSLSSSSSLAAFEAYRTARQKRRDGKNTTGVNKTNTNTNREHFADMSQQQLYDAADSHFKKATWFGNKAWRGADARLGAYYEVQAMFFGACGGPEYYEQAESAALKSCRAYEEARNPPTPKTKMEEVLQMLGSIQERRFLRPLKYFVWAGF